MSFRLSWQCSCGLCFFGMWCHVTGWLVLDVFRPPLPLKTSGTNCPVTRHHIPEEQRPQHGGSKSTFVFSLMTAKSAAGVRVAGGSSLVFIDPSSLRRSTTATAAVAAAAASQEPITMATTASCLARAFGIVVRQIADLLTMLQDYHALAPALPRTLDISYQESINLQVCISL